MASSVKDALAGTMDRGSFRSRDIEVSTKHELVRRISVDLEHLVLNMGMRDTLQPFFFAFGVVIIH